MMESEADLAQQPSAVLRGEHRIIKRVLEVLRRLLEAERLDEGATREALGDCVLFFRLFADACHHCKEEGLLFPVLESRGVPREGGPIGVMLAEHEMARRHTREMGEALEALDAGAEDGEARFRTAAEDYLELLENHIFKEDHVLFNIGDQFMTEGDQETLCRQFHEAGCRRFEGRSREQLETLAETLEARVAEKR